MISLRKYADAGAAVEIMADRVLGMTRCTESWCCESCSMGIREGHGSSFGLTGSGAELVTFPSRLWVFGPNADGRGSGRPAVE